MTGTICNQSNGAVRSRKAHSAGRSLALAVLVALTIGVPWSLSLAPAGYAQAGATGSEAKVDFILTLLQYIYWPNWRSESPGEHQFLISVIGDSSIVPLLMARNPYASINGRTIAVSAAREEDDWTDSQALVFVADSVRDVPRLLQRAHGNGVLTVAIAPDKESKGAVICVYPKKGSEGSQFSLSVDQDAAGEAEIRVSAHLYRLAKTEKH